MNLRDRFPIFQHHPELIYLDSAATAQKPKEVIDALTRFFSEDYATVNRAAYRSAARATEQYHATREAVRRFLNASQPEEIIFTRGTTDSIHLVARSFVAPRLKKGDEILVSMLEHHSNLVPWQMIAQETGAILKIIPILPNGAFDLDAYQNLISDRTRFLAVTHVSNVTGTVTPLREIVQIAHRKGILVLADGAQAAPHLFLDMVSLDVDFYAFSAHKCYGPTGVGILYGKREHLDRMAPLMGGGDMVVRVDWKESVFQEPPLRFEAGTPNIGSIIAFKAAIDFLEEIGRGAIAAWEHRLLLRATRALQSIEGLRILGTAPGKGSILTFAIEGIHPLDLAMRLDLDGIAIRSGHLCAQPLLRHFGCEAVARASFALYNTEAEVDRFALALNEAADRLQSIQ